jgi:hypothetical protein
MVDDHEERLALLDDVRGELGRVAFADVFPEWIVSAGTINASPALYVWAPAPSIAYSSLPSRT